MSLQYIFQLKYSELNKVIVYEKIDLTRDVRLLGVYCEGF